MNDGVVGIIPARGGSKGISDKNIASVAGLPLIAWTIAEARAARSLSRIIVTTDSQKIAEIARQYGAETPFLRPAELARDDTPGIAPILHAVRWLDEHEGRCPAYAMILQPTSPLRTSEDIESSIQLARQHSADGVVSVSPATKHPYWMKRVLDDGRMVNFLLLEGSYSSRQCLPPAYSPNGAIYLVRREVLLEQETLFSERTYAHIMPEDRSLDVDTPWDLYVADLILRDRHGHAAD